MYVQHVPMFICVLTELNLQENSIKTEYYYFLTTATITS